VKELLKSVHICQSYRKTKSGTFLWHTVYKYSQMRIQLCKGRRHRRTNQGAEGWAPKSGKAIIFWPSAKFFEQKPAAKNEKKILNAKNGIHSVQQVPEIRDFFVNITQLAPQYYTNTGPILVQYPTLAQYPPMCARHWANIILACTPNICIRYWFAFEPGLAH